MTTEPTRADAEALLFEFTESDALRKHGRAVEVAMRAWKNQRNQVQLMYIRRYMKPIGQSCFSKHCLRAWPDRTNMFSFAPTHHGMCLNQN